MNTQIFFEVWATGRAAIVEAIKNADFSVWNENRIRAGFNFHCGTFDDFKRFCKNNRETILTAPQMFAIIERNGLNIPAHWLEIDKRYL